ncbi:HET-domain-containing protein [Diaporthe amygdali]|uniref:HET-domain-containing protein n=1 Tax=Phomopsis amygdali TaxID=1214568 RepID=UPI0022FE7F28|nr:HET-domain-containing protein [Diaporthe amygdali]KAJ0118485.1 HET-domain-containing protein [Diaporthe amygdali]
MGLVYRNSSVTISAMASRGSRHGIIPRDVQMEPTLPLPASLRVSNGNEDVVTVLRQDFDEETLKRLDNRSPLSSRGWSLQESILSPRHLYYGRSQLYWRCPTGYQAADGTSSGLRLPEYTLPHVSSVFYRDIRRSQIDEIPVERLLLEDYYALVEMYSHRSLTFSSDKLPAFSGISERLHAVIGGRYLAGIWTTDLAAGLLWRKEMATCKHEKTYRAPSWSWAVTDEEILYDKRGAVPESSRGIRLVDDSIHLKDENNPYGEIESAFITVQGLTLQLIRSRQHIQSRRGLYQGDLLLDDDPPRYEDDNPNMPALVDRTRPLLFRAKNTNGVYLLAITSSLPSIDSELEIDPSLFTSEEYLALIVYVYEQMLEA